MVGGHILLVGVDELGWHAPYESSTTSRRTCTTRWRIGALLEWLVNTVASAVIGAMWGAVVVAVTRVLPGGKGHEVGHDKETPARH